MFAGIVGPRGDAYSLDQRMSVEQAQDYHPTQLLTLAGAEVDLVEEMTFNSVPEAVGVARAAADVGLPASISFMLDSNHRLHSGPTLTPASRGAELPAATW